MELPGVRPRRKRGVITQPVEDREALAGSQPLPPSTTTVSQAEDTDICIRKIVSATQCTDDGALAPPSAMEAGPSTLLSSDEEVVVDMQRTRQLQGAITMRLPGQLERDFSINVRSSAVPQGTSVARDDLEDLQIVEADLEESFPKKKKGPIIQASDKDLLQLLSDTPRTHTGVITESQQVLCCQDGNYEEGLQYRIFPDTQFKGAFGEATMCQDLTTGKTYMRKTVKGKLSRNEVEVPVMFRGNVGIPQVYGVNITDQGTQIFQEFAGMSLKVMRELKPDYVEELRQPHMVMVLAFQAFATLYKLHCKGVTHQDIKPENLCVEKQPNGDWRLKLIDFGSSQTPRDQVIEGLTNEYLSPESCRIILQVASGQLPRASGRLGPGTDVWALSLSLLYCLLGYHVMVYLLTGDYRYQETDPAKLQYLRMSCLVKVCRLSDKDIQSKLIRAEWPEALKTLLVNTLRVDPAQRWSAKKAAQFILQNWILKGFSGQAQASPSPVVTPVVTPDTRSVSAAIVFRGLAAPRLVFQPQTEVQTTAPQPAQRMNEGQAVQCTSPTTNTAPTSSTLTSSSLAAPSPSQLPDFSGLGLLSNTSSSSSSGKRKYVRRGQGKQRQAPYTQPARRSSRTN